MDIKEHNKSKRRRKQKMMLRILRNPEKRETLLQELVAERTPLSNHIAQGQKLMVRYK